MGRRLKLLTLGVLVVSPQMVSLCVRKSMLFFEKRKKLAIDSVLTLLRECVEIPRQSAALHVCVRFSNAFKQSEILNAAQNAALPLVSINGYYPRNERQGEFILPFSAMDEHDLRCRISDFANELKFAV